MLKNSFSFIKHSYFCVAVNNRIIIIFYFIFLNNYFFIFSDAFHVDAAPSITRDDLTAVSTIYSILKYFSVTLISRFIENYYLLYFIK